MRRPCIHFSMAVLGMSVFSFSAGVLGQALPSLDDIDQDRTGEAAADAGASDRDAGPATENLDVPPAPVAPAVQSDPSDKTPGNVEAAPIQGPVAASGSPRFGVEILAGASFPVEPEKGGCKTLALGPFLGLGASYRVADFFEVGVRLSYRYLATTCGDEASASSEGDIPSTLQQGWEGNIAAGTPEQQFDAILRTEIEDHILLAGPLVRLGHAWEDVTFWGLLGGGGGVDLSQYRDYIASALAGSGSQTTSEGYAEAGLEAGLRLMSSPFPLWLGLGASYLQPFPEGWVLGWVNAYLTLSARF